MTTLNYMTKYEKSSIISRRAEDIARGEMLMIKDPGTSDPIKIAKMELEQKIIPYKVIRTLPNGDVEKWSVKDLIII